jgi:2-methylcitrate dehydratase PrpD
MADRAAPPSLVEATHDLADMVSGLQWDELPTRVRDGLRLVLLDLLGVTLAGANTAEHQALSEVWELSAGPATVLGTGRTASVSDAVWLNATASCCLELDEGNKYAQGHPGAHVLFAALAEAQALGVSGPEFLVAALVGHEVAARFGRALRRDPRVHTHGHWGALGAAAAVARLHRLSPSHTAAAIDAAGGLVLATPWESALRGSFVRNTWVAAANTNGRVAAMLAKAGIASVDGTPGLTLGELLGELDTGPLVARLGGRFDVNHGYFKRHSSCSYTHPPADACLRLRAEGGFAPGEIASVLVETNRLAAPLSRVGPPSRLAAMFSIPYVVAVALTEGAVRPGGFDRQHREDATLRALAEKVQVRATAEMDARLPDERAARVTLTLRNGQSLVSEVANPVGDAAHQPFDRARIDRKLAQLVGEHNATRLGRIVDELDTARSVNEVLSQLS